MHLREVTPAAAVDRGDDTGEHPTTGDLAPGAVLRAISVIRERYFEPITLVGLASEVYISPFHFSRVFTRTTGLTPGRFLTAVRLFEAKRLLLTTSLSVADVVCSVGYSSVGTFTSRFARAVGMTPSQYRDPEVDAMLVAVAPQLTRLPSPHLLHHLGDAGVTARPGTGTVTVRVWLPWASAPAHTLVGLFTEPVPQGGPVAFAGKALAHNGDHVTIRCVPSGRWYAMVVAERAPGGGDRVGIQSVPVTVPAAGHAVVTADVRTPRPIDAPVAITLASPSRTQRHGAARLRAAA